MCHGRPRGTAGFGGVVTTRPDSRDSPHLFGLGLKEMLADEITQELRRIRAQAIAEAKFGKADVTKALTAKGIKYGEITATSDGSLDTSRVEGVDADLRVRPFFHHGGTISIREFMVGALQAEMGLQTVDPEMMQASRGGKMTTIGGLVLDGTLDKLEAPPTAEATADPDGDGVKNEVPIALVDYLEFYLLNYFKPGQSEETINVRQGRDVFDRIGCASCHVGTLRIERDRRVADVTTAFDPMNGIFNRLFSTATPLFRVQASSGAWPDVKTPKLEPFVVKDIFTDFKRHDLGTNFHERNYDGTVRTHFLTTPLWGVGSKLAVWPRRPQHQSDRSDPPARR